MSGKSQLAQYDVDSSCRIYMADGARTTQRMFGAGIAYPQRRSDGIILPKKEIKHEITFYKYPKVDSFDLYRTNVGYSVCRGIVNSMKKSKFCTDHFTTEDVNSITNA